MSGFGYQTLVPDSILEAQISKKGAVLFRTNEHIIKLLMWQDMFPVRHDLYFMVEILNKIYARCTDFPPIVRHLLLGLQDKLIDCADARHYEELIQTFIKHKVMYHTVLNIYFQKDFDWWIFYLWACRQWRLNVVSACGDLKYTEVCFSSFLPKENNDTFRHMPEYDVRVNAMMKYLKFFGSEGKRYLKDVKKFESGIDIKGRLRIRRAKDEREKEHMKRPQRPLSTMSRKELHNKKDGIETRYNMHIIMIADKDDLLTENEYIERLERQAQGLSSAMLYYPESADQTDIVKRAAVEHFGRAFVEYRRHTQEYNVPFDMDTGMLLDPEDEVDEEIRSGSWSGKKRKQKPIIKDLEHKLEMAKRGHMKNERSVVNEMFTGATATLAIRASADEFLDVFAARKNARENADKVADLPVERPKDPGKPKMPIKLMYDGETLKNMEAHKIPDHSGAWKKEDPSITKEIQKAQVRTTSKLTYERLPVNGETNSPLPRRPPPEHLPEDMSEYSSVLEFKDNTGHYIIATSHSGEQKNDDGPVTDLVEILKRYGGGNSGDDTVIRGPENPALNDTVDMLKRTARQHGKLIDTGACSSDDKPEVRVIDLTGKTGANSGTNMVKRALAGSNIEVNKFADFNTPSIEVALEEERKRKALKAEMAKKEAAAKKAKEELESRNISINILRDGNEKTIIMEEKITNTKTGDVVIRTEEIKSRNGDVISTTEKVVPVVKKTKSKTKELPPSPKLTKCYVCMKMGKNKKCRRCLSVHYCSKKCQEFNWEEHKAMCRLIREENMLAEQGARGATSLLETEDDEMPVL